MENLIEATILTGPFEGEAVLIPRIPMIPTDLPFQFKRLQFPIRLAFAITINKAQGQSLSVGNTGWYMLLVVVFTSLLLLEELEFCICFFFYYTPSLLLTGG